MEDFFILIFYPDPPQYVSIVAFRASVLQTSLRANKTLLSAKVDEKDQGCLSRRFRKDGVVFGEAIGSDISVRLDACS